MPSDAPIPAPDSDLLPVRMLNEFVYCPRLFHFMHVEGRFVDNKFTIEGRHIHRRVDQLDHVLPDAAAPPPDETEFRSATKPPGRSRKTQTPSGPGLFSDPADSTSTSPATNASTPSSSPGDEPPTISRSVPLGSQTLGLTAKLDLVSTTSDDSGSDAVPVETKRGRVPNNPERSYEPERVQLMAQGLLLREHGYRCDHGVLYFAGSRSRVDVQFTPELETKTRELIDQARLATERKDLPAPLEDSPKCKGCSLNGICLPDETTALQQVPADPTVAPTVDGKPIRRLYPSRDDAIPLYVQEQGAFIGKAANRLIVKKEGVEISTVRLIDLSHLVICGNIGISAQTIQLLCEAGIPIVHMSMGHWFYGVTHGITLRNSYDRAAQFQAAGTPSRCLEFARQLVADKAENQRTLIRRNAAPSSSLDAALRDIDDLLPRIPLAGSLESLLGLEGAVAAIYFGRFADMLKPRDFDARWDFSNRNRRPPRDPVNAMLSFVYALLAKECTVALLTEGLDPYWGFYHQPRHGRPSLALDLMEPLRPTIADSVVITAINTGMVTQRDFLTSASGCMLQSTGRKAVLRAYEGRLDQLITHPMFGYRCSWCAAIRLQARLLSRWLRADIPRFENIITR